MTNDLQSALATCPTCGQLVISRGPHCAVEPIISAACQVFGITHDDLLHGGRHRRLANARNISMYLARKLTSASYLELGRSFERHHSTVISAYKQVSRTTDQRVLADIDRMIAALQEILRLKGNQ